MAPQQLAYTQVPTTYECMYKCYCPLHCCTAAADQWPASGDTPIAQDEKKHLVTCNAG